MTEASLHRVISLVVIGAAVPTLGWLLFMSAPYGRHGRPGWGPTLSPRVGWILMESPSVFGFLGVYFLGAHRLEGTSLAMLALWQLHYVYRTLIFPFRLRSTRAMPISIAVSGFGFNLVNAALNARWISELGDYPAGWPGDPRFVAGLAVFAAGWVINQHADAVLLGLRRADDGAYSVPEGGMYRFVSCPNYLGEMLEWLGWAMLTWSLSGLAFFVFTTANLLPRALAHHRWYRERFPGYPPERRALIPGLL